MENRNSSNHGGTWRSYHDKTVSDSDPVVHDTSRQKYHHHNGRSRSLILLSTQEIFTTSGFYNVFIPNFDKGRDNA